MKILLLTLAFIVAPVSASWEDFSRSGESLSLEKWLRQSAENILSRKPCTSFAALPVESKGLFVTIIKKGSVRGCYGAFYHNSSDASTLLLSYLRGALRSDWRYRPLDISELNECRFVVTAADMPFGIDDIGEVDLSEYGIAAETDNGMYAIVPAEYRSAHKVEEILATLSPKRLSAFKAITVTPRR